MDIAKTNFAGFLIGALLFLWFCWPAVFKGMLNAGNLCGMFVSAVLMFYSIRFQAIHKLAAQLWQKKPMRFVFWGFGILIVAAALLVAAASFSIMRAASEKIPANTTAVVLGCAVKAHVQAGCCKNVLTRQMRICRTIRRQSVFCPAGRAKERRSQKQNACTGSLCGQASIRTGFIWSLRR